MRDFRQVFRGKYLLVKNRQNGLSYARLGVLVSRRASLKATERNRLKRMIFDFFGRHFIFFEKKAGYDWLISFLTSTGEIFNNREILYKELDYVLHL